MFPQTTNINDFRITFFNKEELKILKKEIFQNQIYSINLKNPSPTILDVGAHIGLATLFFKERYPNSTISSFEPNPNTYPLLEENIEINGLKKVRTYNFGFGRKECIRDLYIDKSGNGAFSTASFLKNAWNGEQKTKPIQIQIKRLSKHINESIDILKIDVEGAEWEIMEDLEKTNRFPYIKNILLEYHPRKNSKVTTLTNILKNNGFDLKYMYEGKKIEEPKEDLILIVAKKRV